MPEDAAPRALTVGLVVGSPLGSDQGGVRCGVRDYAGNLAQALRADGVAARVIAPASWRMRDGLAFVKALRAAPLDIVHLQYPSIGHRYSLLPHLLGFAGAGRRCVVTLHEHSALKPVQRIASQAFRLSADRIVFGTDYEAAAFGAPRPPVVIPIGSNIPVHPGTPARGDTVLYFGQLRHGKGIEDFLALARLAEAAGDPARFAVIGTAPPRWQAYARALRAQSPASVTWQDNAEPAEIAAAMATAAAAYLPFPDGAGLRRGSLMAALFNRLPVIAPLGPSTTEGLQAALFAAATPEAALAQLRLLRAAPDLARRRSEAGRNLVQPFTWAAIADRHKRLYRGLLARQARPAPARAVEQNARPW